MKKELIPAVTMLAMVAITSLPPRIGTALTIHERFEKLNEYYAQHFTERPTAFHDLSFLQLDVMNDYFPEGIRIWFDDATTIAIDDSVTIANDPACKPLVSAALNLSDSNRYTIGFSAGPSVDPHFIIYAETEIALVKIGEISALELFIPGDGFIYSRGHTNSMFDKWRKFSVTNDELVEIAQPFYYVGMKTHTITETFIRSKRFSDEGAITIIPEGTDVTVLLNDGDWYLLLTDTGMTGWLKISGGYDSPLMHIFFRGD